MPACSIPGCNGVYQAAGYCYKHYRRYWLHGDPMREPNRRFWVLADCWTQGLPDECWIWRGPVDRGAPKWRGKSAPRVVYTELRGAPDRSHILEHTCGNRLCVNPDHLVGTTRSVARSLRNRGG